MRVCKKAARVSSNLETGSHVSLHFEFDVRNALAGKASIRPKLNFIYRQMMLGQTITHETLANVLFNWSYYSRGVTHNVYSNQKSNRKKRTNGNGTKRAGIFPSILATLADIEQGTTYHSFACWDCRWLSCEMQLVMTQREVIRWTTLEFVSKNRRQLT